MDDAVEIIAFGSCADERGPAPIWKTIVEMKPDAFVLLGDNVYIDSGDPKQMDKAWARLGRRPGYRQLAESTPIFGVWDDHDFGKNDAGVEWAGKWMARTALLDFFAVPADAERRTRGGAIYDAVTWGSADHVVQLVLLDTRWDRTPLKTADRRSELRGQGPYVPNPDPAATLLGEDQWAWLADRLAQPAALHLVGSSIPVLPEFTGWETWANMPLQRQRLIEAARAASGPVVFLSGDTHWAELSHIAPDLYELGSSGLTESWDKPADNIHRQGGLVATVNNFGVVGFDWARRVADLQIRDVRGATLWSQSVPMGPP